jgi:hypothetical protein
LFDAVKPIGDPTEDERLRVRTNIVRQIGAAAFTATVAGSASAASAGAGAAASAAAGAGATAGTVATGVGLAGVPIAAKIGVLALIVVTGAGGVVAWKRGTHEAPVPRETPVAQTPVAQTTGAAPEASVPALVVPPPTAATATATGDDTPPPSQSAPTKAIANRATNGSRSAAMLDDEVRLITQAQAALREGRPAEARALTDEHARLFPHGQLAEERESVRILAGCALGDLGAKTRAEQFVRRAPKSPLSDRIRRACRVP